MASPISRKSSFPEDNGWETEDQGGDKEEEGSSGGDDDNSDEADRKRRNRVSTSSILSDGSTLIGGEMDDGGDQEGGEDEVKDAMRESERRNSNGGYPSTLFSAVGPIRAMTSPIPVRPMSMISTPSPLSYASPTTHRRNRSNGGLGRGDSPGSSARYIDYLERQIADTVSQLQSYTSPSEGTSHAVKMRKLTAETRLLRSELTDWENKFSARVKEEVNTRAAIDKSLRTKIKSLEAKLEEAEYRYKTAEVDLEEARATISDLKGVEEENRALEFRIEALSELLADSTRLAQSAGVGGSGYSSAASSRPGSVVFPKRSSSLESSSSAPSPTTSPRTQLRYAAVVTTTGGKNTPVEGRSQRVSREGSTCALEDYGITDPIEAVLCSMSQLAATEEEEGVEGEPRYPEEYEAELNPNTALIRTSPHPPPAILRNRRMRRFPSGSSAPKTLILPSAAAVTATTTTTVISPTFPATSHTTSGIFAPFSRPPSSSSSSSSCCAPPQQVLKVATPQTSLFAELARAQDSSEDSEEEEEEEEDTEAELDEDDDVAAAATISEGLTNPTPLVVKTISKVGESYISPQGTFFRAKRKAMDILGGVVGNRVSRPYHHHLQPSPKPPSSLSLSPRRPARKVLSEKNQRNKSPPTTATTCAYCHCHQQPPSSTAITAPKAVAQTRPRSTSAPLVLPQPVEEAVEHVWLWVRFVVALVVALGVAVREGPGVIVAVDGVGSIGGSAASSISSSSVGDAGGFDGVGEEERCFAIKKLQQQGAAASGRGVVESRVKRGRRGLGWGEDRVRVWERPGDR